MEQETVLVEEQKVIEETVESNVVQLIDGPGFWKVYNGHRLIGVVTDGRNKK